MWYNVRHDESQDLLDAEPRARTGPSPGGCYRNTWLTGLAKQFDLEKGYKYEN
jgi:hypothetical protein